MHLVDAAKAISLSGVKVNLVTGWVPSEKIPDSFLNILGLLLGRKNLAYGLRKRIISNSCTTTMHTCTFAEFFIQILFLLSKFHIVSRDQAAVIGWKMYGYQSKKYIKNAEILHIRSGAGQGGAIAKAKKNGMKIVVDHSIAHPAEAFKQLVKSNNGSLEGITISLASKFWQMVLADCMQADMIVVNSDYVKKSFTENGFDSNKLRVIPLGVRADFFGLKNKYCTHGPTKLLFTGGFGRRKGAKIIVEAMEILFATQSNFKLDIVGTSINDIIIPQWFREQPEIQLHGHIPQVDLKAFLSTSDIYIFPSYCEGAAQSLKEAMAAGLPVIATAQSGAPIIHGENGWIIPDDSSKSLAEAIVHLKSDENLREKLGRNAANTIIKEHTWEKYGKMVAEFYASIR